MSQTMHFNAMLILVFIISFLTAFSAVTFSNFNYVIPTELGSARHGNIDIAVAVGPQDNSTNISLNTAVVVSTFRNPELANFTITPELPVDHISRKVDLSSLTVYFLGQPLRPATNYNVSVSIKGETIQWSFTTTSSTLSPLSSFEWIIASNKLLFSLFIAFVITSLATIILRILRKKT